MDIQIHKGDNTPIYKQIVGQILVSIQKSDLKTGDKLPSERLLSDQLEVSRGTITKAYNELSNMSVVTLVKGKGCFVSDEKSFLSLGRKEKAVVMIKNMMSNLEELGFSLSEIRIFSEIVLMEKEKNYSTIRIGIIDCNREALHAIQCQIGSIKEITINKYLLEELDRFPLQSEILDNDIIVTTYSHYDEVLEKIPAIEDNLIRVAMSPSSKTLVEIARITQNKSVGILYDSDTFLEVIERSLKLMEVKIDPSMTMKIQDLNLEQIGAFIKKKEVLITPPITFFEISFRRWLMHRLENKQKIEFNYIIERGNFLYLEEKIRKLMVSR